MDIVNYSEPENKLIHSQRMAGFLMLHGFRLQSIRPDAKARDRNVFIFRDSDKLCTAMRNYNKKTEEDE